VQYKVISALYEQNLGCAQPLSDIQTATEVFKLEQELNLWRHCVAPPLRIRSHDTVSYDSEAACEERFRVVLTLRYLNLQTLLHRPFVAKSLDDRTGRREGAGSTTSAERLASGSIQTCIKSAEEVISIVHTIISAKRAHDLLGAWWFSLYYGRQSRPPAYHILTYIHVHSFWGISDYFRNPADISGPRCDYSPPFRSTRRGLRITQESKRCSPTAGCR
jgi:hypothetical protein